MDAQGPHVRYKNTFLKFLKVFLLVIIDSVLVNLSAFLTLFLRLELSLTTLLGGDVYFDNYFSYAVFFTLIAVALFSAFKMYRSLWEFAGIEEFVHIMSAVIALNIVYLVIILLNPGYLPRSFPFINLMILSFMTLSVRFSYRIFRMIVRRHRRHRGVSPKRTMVIGGGTAGSDIIRQMKNSSGHANEVICVIDDDPMKIGSSIYGVKIMGNRYDIPDIAEQFNISEIVIALPSATVKNRHEIIDICQKTSCTLRTLPDLLGLMDGKADVAKIRDVRIDDLLGRDSVVVNSEEISEYVRDKVVLVTGGGGSIGSELCRQVAKNAPSRLIILDIYENNAYSLEQELRYEYPDLAVTVLIGSVRDEKRLDAVFMEYSPSIVYHAAAHKHVPLMETSPAEAIKNNVLGTYNTADAAHRHGAETFILISTDKAVNPTNIMGASKRICEMIVEYFADISSTKFAAVRFGNVLGSNGSVVPLFKRQIERGGPVTVTHPDIIRYFMTIPEAVSLVLQAGAYADAGEIFVLDMGEPVKIDELARKMIRLSGLEPDTDIKITYTGLREGEKLFEELLLSGEDFGRTPNNLIFIGHPKKKDSQVLLAELEELRLAAADADPSELRRLIARIVPEYHTEPAPHSN